MNALITPQPWPLQRRDMLAADLLRVVNVEIRAYSHPWSRGNFIDSLAAGYIAELLESRDAGLVGYFVAMPGVDELHLLNITVAPDWQGRGHGTALLDVVQARALERGLGTLWLEVRESNHRARALYRRRGFAEVGLRRGYYPAAGGREDAVVMSLPLVRREETDLP
jgi:[ribosomal protein S18]-alanine N-acetyltransferase